MRSNATEKKAGQMPASMRELRRMIASRGILTIGELADRIGRSRESIYFAVERPSRYPLVWEKLREILHGN